MRGGLQESCGGYVAFSGVTRASRHAAYISGSCLTTYCVVAFTTCVIVTATFARKSYTCLENT